MRAIHVEKGHFSLYCMKQSQEYLGHFPTKEVEFDRQEIEELIGTKNVGRERAYIP